MMFDTSVYETDCTRLWICICIHLLTCLRLQKQNKDGSQKCFQNKKMHHLMTTNKYCSQKFSNSGKAETFSCCCHKPGGKHHTRVALCARHWCTCIRETTSQLGRGSQQYSPYLGRSVRRSAQTTYYPRPWAKLSIPGHVHLSIR